MKVRVRPGKRLEHEGKLYMQGGPLGDVVDVGEDAARVKWLQEIGTADPVDEKAGRNSEVKGNG